MPKKSRTSKKKKNESLCTISFTANELARVMVCLDAAMQELLSPKRRHEGSPEFRQAYRKVLVAYQERPLERRPA